MARKNRREYLVPELTPLIDVVFLLLIFFMVSSVFKKEELALLLNLPKAQDAKAGSSKDKSITIELSKSELALGNKKIKISELENQIKGVDKTTLVNLRVDGSVQYERLVKVLDLLQKNKLENLSLITVKKR